MPFHALHGCSLLVVEGDSDLGAFIADVLADAGADVAGPWATASGARGCLDKRRPDAALLDVNLRDGNSYAFAAELDALGVRYAFLSSSDPTDVPKALNPFAFLGKPVSIADLVAVAVSLTAMR